MPELLARLDPEPAGFGKCGECAYRESGSALVCFTCASAGMELVGSDHCEICNQQLPESQTCSNYWCRRPLSERHFAFIHAIAMRSGPLERAISRYKYPEDGGHKGWAAIFGRVLVGYMDAAPDRILDWDAIVPSPTFVGPGSRRRWDHIGLIIEKATVEAADRWPQLTPEPDLIVKTADTPSLVGKRVVERREIAETQIRASLSLPDPSRWLVDDSWSLTTCSPMEAHSARLPDSSSAQEQRESEGWCWLDSRGVSDTRQVGKGSTGGPQAAGVSATPGPLCHGNNGMSRGAGHQLGRCYVKSVGRNPREADVLDNVGNQWFCGVREESPSLALVSPDRMRILEPFLDLHAVTGIPKKGNQQELGQMLGVEVAEVRPRQAPHDMSVCWFKEHQAERSHDHHVRPQFRLLSRAARVATPNAQPSASVSQLRITAAHSSTSSG